jgi:lipopolysaccharide export system protein LptA
MRGSSVLGRLGAGAVLALMSGHALAQESTEGRLSGLKLEGNKPIQIESDRLEIREADSIAIFSGNVAVVQGPTTLKAGKMTVHYAKDGGSAATGSSSIERIEVDEKVYVKSNAQTATGDRGTFDMKTEVLVLSGDEVVLSEGPNVLVGCKLTVQMRSGEATVDGCKTAGSSTGRVQMSITPSSQSQ